MLKGIETGDQQSVAVVDPDKYIQHNPQTHEGREGLASLFKRLAQTSPRVKIVRLFSDGDFVFGHTEYDFNTLRVGFEVFRFEGDLTVEHWDNIQPSRGPNASGRSMVDGTVEVSDWVSTETNRRLIIEFIDSALIARQYQQLPRFISPSYIEHNPRLTDGLEALTHALQALDENGDLSICYETRHRVLAEGNFVLSVCEGYLGGAHTSFYDLFRISGGIIVEHWDTTETVPPLSQWHNDNGKF
nr:hypothetical protein [Shewanella sp. NIFS-20-20]